MRIRPPLSLCLAAAMFSLLSAQAAPPHGAPSASQPASPKESLLAFFKSAAAGDSDKVFEQLWFKDDAAKKEAQAVIGLELAKERLDQAIADKLNGDKPGDPLDIKSDMQKRMIDAVEKADVKIDGDTAQISSSGEPLMYMVRHDGKWQIDFAKMQETNPEVHLAPDEVDSNLGQLKIYQAALDNVNANKYATADEARADIKKRLDDFEKADPTAKIKSARTSIAMIKQALATFEVQEGRFPTEAEGLDALVHQPAGIQDWHPYFEKLPKDPWGHDFVYHNPSKRDKDSFYDLFSPGPDGKPDTDDDVTEGGRGKGK